MNEERIKELFSDEIFVKDLFESESYEAAQKKLADKDVSVSIDELKKAVELLKKRQSGEISDEELENVAGGMDLITGIVIYLAGGVILAGLVGGAAYAAGC